MKTNIKSLVVVLTSSIYGIMLFVSSICSAASYPTSTATPLATDLSMNLYKLNDVGDIITRGPWVDARAYGVVVGDGTTDNATALQNAANAAAGGILQLPPGIITLKSRFQPASNTWVRGSGKGVTILKAIATFTTDEIIDVVSKSNVKISDLTCNANAQSVIAACVQIDQSDDCEVSNIETINGFSGIEILGNGMSANRNLVAHNYLHDATNGSLGMGILLFAGAQKTRIIGNQISNCASYQILIDGGTSGGGSTPSNDNVVSDNIINSTTGWGIGVEGSHRNLVQNNNITLPTTISYGLLCDRDNTTGNPLPQDNTFLNNIVNGAMYGMRIDGLRTRVQDNKFIGFATDGIRIEYQGGGTAISRAQILDNYITGGSGDGISLAEGHDAEVVGNRIFSMTRGIYVVMAHNRLSVKRNYIYGSTQEAILVGQRNMTDVAIDDNWIVNASTSGAGLYAAINLDAVSVTISRVSIQRNVYSDDAGSAMARSVVYVKGTPTSILVRDNRSLRTTVPENENGTNGASDFLQTGSGTSYTPNVGLGKVHTVTATGNLTINVPTNAVKGDTLTIIVLQGATGGKTVTWNAVFKNDTWSSTGNSANKRSAISFVNDGTYWVQVGKQTGWY